MHSNEGGAVQGCRTVSQRCHEGGILPKRPGPAAVLPRHGRTGKLLQSPVDQIPSGQISEQLNRHFSWGLLASHTNHAAQLEIVRVCLRHGAADAAVCEGAKRSQHKLHLPRENCVDSAELCFECKTKSIIHTYNSIDLFALLYLPPLYTIYCVIVSFPSVYLSMTVYVLVFLPIFLLLLTYVMVRCKVI